MLSALRESGYSVTVVSNTTHEEVRAWNSCELANLIEDPGSSELAGARRFGVEPIWATWFLERWPGWRMSEVEPGAASCRRCRDPADLIGIVRDL